MPTPGDILAFFACNEDCHEADHCFYNLAAGGAGDRCYRQAPLTKERPIEVTSIECKDRATMLIILDSLGACWIMPFGCGIHQLMLKQIIDRVLPSASLGLYEVRQTWL